MAAWRVRIEKWLFGTPLDDVYERIGELNRRLDRLSARLDERAANIRKGLQAHSGGQGDPRDGLYIVEEECIGCQLCVDLAPGTFRMRDGGVAEIIDPHGDDLAAIEEAIAGCGSACIKLA